MKTKNLKLITAILFVLAALAYGWIQPELTRPEFGSTDTGVTVEALFQNRISGEMVEFQGRVSRILPDDNDGSRHQRFIVSLASSHTVLIAHNIDLAPRVPLQIGRSVSIFGQYEWNEKGGVVHWTHKDPRGTHVAGWIQYQGHTYH